MDLDLEVDLDALGLGQPSPAVAADDKGSYGSAMLTPSHGTQGTLEGGIMKVRLVVCLALPTHPKKMQFHSWY